MDPSDPIPLQEFENRRTARLSGPYDATWALRPQNLTGRCVIQNLSADGVCVQLDREFAVQPGALILLLEAPAIPALPLESKIRWFRRPARRRLEKPKGFQCGAVFSLDIPEVAQRWALWYADAKARQDASLPGSKPTK